MPYIRASQGGGGKWICTAVVTAPSGSTITVSGGGETLTATSTGVQRAFYVHKKSTTYTITVSLNGATKTDTFTTTTESGLISYYEFKFGTINVNLWSQFIGKDIRCFKSNAIDETKQADTTLLTFTVPETGYYSIFGNYASNNIYITHATVTDLDTPVNVDLVYYDKNADENPNDVQSWLASAGIFDSEYTTLSEILADTDLLWDLLENYESLLYLKASTSWATDICNNYDAMFHINASLDALDILGGLGGSSVWADAIQASIYRTSSSQVPTMTSNTDPSGECFASSESSSSYAAWKAFDSNSSSTYWRASGSAVPSYVGYKFENPEFITSVKLQCASDTYSASKFKIQASNDGEEWVDVSEEFTTAIPTTLTEYNLINPGNYLYYRLYIISLSSSSYAARIRHIELYNTVLQNIDIGVRNWLHSTYSTQATNNHYYTLNQVLSDLELLKFLMSDVNSVDYLTYDDVMESIEYTDWINSITNSQNAMIAIGSSSYAINTFLQIPEWADALLNSPYRSYVFSELIPIMTSDTEPLGECFVTSDYSPTSTYKAYKAFDGIEETYARLIGSDTENYICYDFGENQQEEAIAFEILLGSGSSSSIQSNKTYKIQGSDDNNTWDDLVILENPTKATFDNIGLWKGAISTPDNYRYYRIWFNGSINSTSASYIRKFDLFGKTFPIIGEKIQIQSAPNDTVYYYSSENVKIDLCTTNDAGIGYVLKENLPVGCYIFYSTIARDKNHYNENYSKVVQIFQNTKIVNLIPEKAIYWYGIKTPLYQKCTTANGWSSSNTLSESYVQEYRNAIGINASRTNTGTAANPSYSYTIGAIGTSIAIPNNSDGQSIVYVVYSSSTSGRVGVSSGKSTSSSSTTHYKTISSDYNVTHLDFSNTGSSFSNIYVYLYNTGSTSTSTPAPLQIYALWVE